MLKVYSNLYYFFMQLLANTKFGKSSNTQPFFNVLYMIPKNFRAVAIIALPLPR